MRLRLTYTFKMLDALRSPPHHRGRLTTAKRPAQGLGEVLSRPASGLVSSGRARQRSGIDSLLRDLRVRRRARRPLEAREGSDRRQSRRRFFCPLPVVICHSQSVIWRKPASYQTIAGVTVHYQYVSRRRARSHATVGRDEQWTQKFLLKVFRRGASARRAGLDATHSA